MLSLDPHPHAHASAELHTRHTHLITCLYGPLGTGRDPAKLTCEGVIRGEKGRMGKKTRNDNSHHRGAGSDPDSQKQPASNSIAPNR